MAAKTFNPLRRQTGLIFEPQNEGLHIIDEASGRFLTLGTAESLLWGYLDGERSVGEIATAISAELGTHIEVEGVWRSLDGLSDLGLLEVRVAPPAGDSPVGRRRFLQFGSALLAGSVSALAPVAAFADCPVNFDPALPENAELLAKEMDCKVIDTEGSGKASEQAGKNSLEHQDKASEQVYKTQNEQDYKQEQAQQEQLFKLGQQEANDKSFETNDKYFEQLDKIADANLEVQNKTSFEQSSKSGEISSKESFGKLGGGGGNITPGVPEPATLTLFGLGIAAVAATAWRRKNVVPEHNAVEDSPPPEDDSV